MVCYPKPLVVKHGLLCLASGCESWFILLSQWLLIMACNSERVVVNHCPLYGANGWES